MSDLKSVIVNVQIQFDQFGDGCSEAYTMDTLNQINGVIYERFRDICPQILSPNNISPEDIEVTECDEEG